MIVVFTGAKIRKGNKDAKGRLEKMATGGDKHGV